MNGELLTADGSRAREQARLVLAVVFLEDIKHGLVIEVGVIVMHLVRVGTVVVDNIGGYALAEVGLEAVNSHFAERFELIRVPLAGIGICEIHDSHSGLPHIRLEYGTVLLFYEVAFLHTFAEHGRTLGDIGIDPDAYLYVLCLEALQHSRRLREHILVPCEVAPAVFLHPEAVEVEYFERYIAALHFVNEERNCLFVVVRGERCCEPQTESERGRKSGLAGEIGIYLQYIGYSFTAEHEVFEMLTLYGERNFGDGLARYLEHHLFGVVDEAAVAL